MSQKTESGNHVAILNSFLESISSDINLQGIVDRVGDKLQFAFDLQSISICLFDPGTKLLTYPYVFQKGKRMSVMSESATNSWNEFSNKWEKSFQQQTLGQDLSKFNLAQKSLSTSSESELVVPILADSKAIGQIIVQSHRPNNTYSSADLNLLLAIALSMGIGLENARLYANEQRARQELEREIVMARQAQQSILPKETPSQSGYDFGALMIPAREVGGDFYQFINLDENRLGIVIGDVAGKGLPAALIMALSYSLINVEATRASNPREALTHVNRYLYTMDDSGSFVTALYGILDYRTGEFCYARAGHPLPIILDRHGKEINIALERSMALGVMEEVYIGEQRVTLPPGGLILLYTDGINEVSDPQGNEFGIRRIYEALVNHQSLDASVICEKLWQTVAIHSGSDSHQDDFTALIIKKAD